MKIAISTCQTGMVESLSAMFSEHQWHILGIRKPTPDWQFHMRVDQRLGRDVYNHYQEEEPIEKINIDDYDLLIDVAESNDYNPLWRETAINWNIPRILYITSNAPKTRLLRSAENYFGKTGFKIAHKLLRHLDELHQIFFYYDLIGKPPIVYTNEQLQYDWQLKGQVIHFSHDEWGIGEWIGDEPIMLLGKNGFYTWSKPTGKKAKFFDELFYRLGKKFSVHDSSFEPMAEWDWRNYVAHKRLWFEHDFGSTGRSLCQGLVKAMCLGLPVLQWKTPICQGWRFIENGVNGLVTNNMDEAVTFALRLLHDFDQAKEYSKEMVKAYKKHLSWEVAKPKWEQAMQNALRA